MKSVNFLGIAGLVARIRRHRRSHRAGAPAVELKVGDKAPNFKLQGSDGKTYSLADFAGKKAVVIAWFPAAFTKGCTVECKSLAMNGDKIRQYDVAYFMASTDPDREEHRLRQSPGSGLPAAERPDEGSRGRLRRAEREGDRAPLDVLHRQGRPDPRDRQGRQGRDVG